MAQCSLRRIPIPAREAIPAALTEATATAAMAPHDTAVARPTVDTEATEATAVMATPRRRTALEGMVGVAGITAALGVVASTVAEVVAAPMEVVVVVLTEAEEAIAKG